jgi:hypothetical protein
MNLSPRARARPGAGQGGRAGRPGRFHRALVLPPSRVRGYAARLVQPFAPRPSRSAALDGYLTAGSVRAVDAWVGGALALLGVVLGLAIDLLRDSRKASAAKAARRWDVEYESLRELGDVLSTFVGPQEPDLERRKVRATALAFRVRDNRVRLVVDPLMAIPVGSQEWLDEVGNSVRIVGEVMRAL